MTENIILKTTKKTTVNKTGAWRTFVPKIDLDKCSGCGICASYCPEECIDIMQKGGKKKADVNYDYCKGCMLCLTICPLKAITSEQEEKK
ncbi:MAG: 4Fe-4S binding protein [Candidatus Aenigmatarchaeota archaeon]